jgi:hypothetical protein
VATVANQRGGFSHAVSDRRPGHGRGWHGAKSCVGVGHVSGARVGHRRLARRGAPPARFARVCSWPASRGVGLWKRSEAEADGWATVLSGLSWQVWPVKEELISENR